MFAVGAVSGEVLTGAPHWVQNLSSGSSSLPHVVQNFMTNLRLAVVRRSPRTARDVHRYRQGHAQSRAA